MEEVEYVNMVNINQYVKLVLVVRYVNMIKECKLCASQCKLCGGSGICEHDKKKTQCIQCGGIGICEHNKRKTKQIKRNLASKSY